MGKTKSKISDLDSRVSKLETQMKQVKELQVYQMLQEKNSPFSDKFRYTYEEIHEATGWSNGSISNFAKDKGLSRRNVKTV